MENIITFKIKSGYYHKRLTPELMKLLGSTKNKITKDKNGENVLHLEVTLVILVPGNLVKNSYQVSYINLFQINPFVKILVDPNNNKCYYIFCCYIWPVWPNGWVFVYKLSGCGFESRCSRLNVRYHACF